VSKHKQKATKLKNSKRKPTPKFQPLLFRVRNRRLPILVGLAVALVGGPASWLAVNAQVPDVLKSGNSALVDKASAGGSKGTDGSQTQQTASRKTNATPEAQANAKAAEAKKVAQSDAAKAAAKPGATNATSAATAGATPPAAAAPKAATSQAAPTPAPSPTGWHGGIKTTIFWVGEAADASNAHISNAESAWDGNWQTSYGGYDDPAHRNGYLPAGFTPRENPFYFALPYNDLDIHGNRKSSAGTCPNAGASGVSWCKNSWIKITKGNTTAYAQWQDVGPLQEDDTAYVFGTAGPINTWGAKAGLDVSPAVRDYLGLQDVDTTGWSFVTAGSVPAGPWKNIVTTSPGGW
jgi:hypothetical protein